MLVKPRAVRALSILLISLGDAHTQSVAADRGRESAESPKGQENSFFRELCQARPDSRHSTLVECTALGLELLTPLTLGYTSSAATANCEMLRKTSRFAAARLHCRRAVQLDPENHDARFQYGALLRQLRDPDGAIRQYMPAAKAGHEDATAAMVGIWAETGELGKAIEWAHVLRDRNAFGELALFMQCGVLGGGIVDGVDTGLTRAEARDLCRRARNKSDNPRVLRHIEDVILPGLSGGE